MPVREELTGDIERNTLEVKIKQNTDRPEQSKICLVTRDAHSMRSDFMFLQFDYHT
ncbi:hypothetical protein PVAG01_06591 [Phlyctema vagabunda]|uniref:Uncharacterized protein n=1 Tax=Phlyctema vagabunda TaxID=108571 RepID=A0ABR4PGM5_9HELO